MGYHAVHALLAAGHCVATLSKPPLPARDLFPPEVNVSLGDFNALEDRQIISLFSGCDALVFAAGVDDRVVPRAPAYPFFYEGNVLTTDRAIRLAREAGVRKAVVFSSYFLECDKRWPELCLSDVHPYIRSRKEQAEACLRAAGDDLGVSFLLLPYIFGSMPGRPPLWKPLLKYLDSALPVVFYPEGGSAMVSVDEVAQATVAALERGEPGAMYPVGAEDLTWREWIGRLLKLMGKHKPVLTLPKWMVKLGAWCVHTLHKLRGLESGLNLVPFVELQTRLAYLDGNHTREVLGYPGAPLQDALEATVAASLEPKTPTKDKKPC